MKDFVSIKKYSLISTHFLELALFMPAYELLIKKTDKRMKKKLLIDNRVPKIYLKEKETKKVLKYLKMIRLYEV